MGMENFDRHEFTVISLSFAIPIAVILIIWFLLMELYFRWRPFKLGRLIISHKIGKGPRSIYTNVALAFWWIFFFLPFAGFIAWGIVIGLTFKPYFLGVIIAVLPTIILFMIYLFFDYHHRGYDQNNLSKAAFSICVIIILALIFGSIYMLQPQSWMDTAFLFASLPLIFFMLAYAACHLRIPNLVIERALESQDRLNMFTSKFAQHDKSIFTGSKKLNVGWSFGIFFFSLVINFLFALNFYFKKTVDGYDVSEASYATALGFFVIDFILLLSQIGAKILPSFFFYLFLAFLVKVCAITFSVKYWITGHGVSYFFISSFLLIRFFIGVWRPQKKMRIENPNNDRLIKDLSNLALQSKKLPIVTVIMTIISWIILTACYVVEMVLRYNNTFEPLPFAMTQQNASIGAAVLSIPFSFITSACFYLYYNSGYLNAGTYVLYFISIVGLCVFDGVWQGAKHLLLLRLLLPALFVFAFGCITLMMLAYFLRNNKIYFCPCSKHSFNFIFFLCLTLAGLALSIILPFACNKEYEQHYDTSFKLSGLIVVLIIIFLICFAFFSISLFAFGTMKNAYSVATFILSICALVGFSCCFHTVLQGAIIFCSVFVIFCLIFAFLYTRNNNWTFSLPPYLIAAIPSLVVLVLSVVGIFLLDDHIYDFYLSLVALAFAFVFFGSSLLFWLQKRNFYFSFPSIASLAALIVSVILVIIFIAIEIKKAFVTISIIFLVFFLASFISIIFFVLSQSLTNVIVFSNIFFPVRRLVDGHIHTIKLFNFLYACTFISPYAWGLFASIFLTDYEHYGALGSVCAVFLITFITCYYITQFDSHIYTAIGFIQSKELEYAINTAMDASNIKVDMPKLEKPDLIDYQNYLDYVAQKVAFRRDVSAFLSAVKAQLYISSDVSFRAARERVQHYFYASGVSENELAFLGRESGWSTSSKLKVYELLNTIKTIDPSRVDDEIKYDNHVKQQEIRRQNLIFQNVDAKKYHKLLSKCQHEHTTFVDPEFNKSTDTENLVRENPWRRMEEMYHTPMFAESQGYNNNIIKQGKLGDCYFVSALVAISRKPKIVSTVFDEPINNDQGIRCVKFHIMGNIVPVVVDTTVPFTGNTDISTPKFCKPVTKEDPWWGTIVEKAYAKVYGSYEAIDGGNAHVALYRLVGGYPICYYLKEMKTTEMIQNGQLWKIMMGWYKAGGFLCAGSLPGRDSEKNIQGIVFGHAYTILRVAEVYGNQLIQLRNPWGNTEWKGDWCDSSKKWTNRIRNALNYHDTTEDGVFWMSFKDFTMNYNSLYASIQPGNNFQHYALNGSFKPSEKDGAKPFDSHNDALSLPQWVIRIKHAKSSSKVNFLCFFEKTGAQIPCWTVFAYNNGKPIQLLFQGTKHHTEAIASQSTILSFDWEYEDPNSPVTLFFYRNKSSSETFWHFEIYTETHLEITPLSK